MSDRDRYPERIGEAVDADGHPLYLEAPHPFIVFANCLFKPESEILYLGTYRGSNSFYLAEQGHKVTSVESNVDHVIDAAQIAKHLGDLAANNTLVHGDIHNPDLYEQFDVVISTTGLASVTQKEGLKAVAVMQDLTREGGLNVIRAYNGEPKLDADGPRPTIYPLNLLVSEYEREQWSIIHSTDTPRLIGDESGTIIPLHGNEIIARKPMDPRTKAMLEEAELLRRKDPERAADLLALAQN